MVQELPGQEAILESVAAGIIAFLGDRIVYANSAAQTLTGRTMPELAQLPFSSLFMPECLPRFQTLHDIPPPHRVELRLKNQSGETWIELATLPVNINGAPALLATMTDISHHKRELETLRRSEQQFKVLVEANPDVIVRRDLDLRYRYVNPTLRNYLGRSLEEMVGKTMEEMNLPPDEIERVSAAIEQVIQTRQTVAMETHLPRPDTIIHFDTRIVPELDDAGNVISTVLYSRDISRRKYAEEAVRQSEARLRAILENMPVMLNAFDKDFRVLFWNQECQRITGYPAAEVLGRTDVMSLLYTDAERERMYAEYAALGNNFREKEWTLIGKDGTPRVISWSNISEVIPIPGWELWAIGIDVTERRRVETLLHEQERLRVALEHEQTSGELRRQMMETLHHEFRTPLAVIQTSADMLERYLERLTPDKRQEYFTQIRQQIGHTTTMLETISTIMELQYGGFILNFESFNFSDLFARVIDTIQRRENRGHQFEFVAQGSSFRIMGDVEALRRACEHMLLNAVKYSPADSTIHITLVAHESEIQLQIVDHGTGISDEDYKHIFEPFFRGSNISYATGGIGLGLTLVKAVIEHHHGSIHIHSAPGSGTTLTLVLPRVPDKNEKYSNGSG